MSADTSFVIAGASLAGAKAAEALRDEGFDGEIVLIGAEEELPYERPPLSKGYLQGKSEREKIFVHPRDWYDSKDIDLRLGQTVTAIDPAGRQVYLAGGEQLGYRKLLLATGSSPRPLPVPGAQLGGVHTLRSVRDSEEIRSSFNAGGPVVVIGGGWIGLETAAAARAAGLEVTVLEAAELPLLHVLGREMAAVFARLHRDHGVGLRCGAQALELAGHNGQVTEVQLADGARVAASLVIIGAGITPNAGLAASAGLEVSNGVRVSAALQSSDPDIYAAGDVASAYHPLLGRPLRVEHWANALNQPQAAARAMLGQEVSYDRVPYFFSDQYDLGMEYAGFAGPDDYDRVVVRGDADGREFIAFWLTADNRVLAGMNVNVWDVQDDIQRLVRAGLGGQPVDPARLADPNAELAELLP
jgi:3-phenylpropionate/trans-cinnamate dioxygenase ferredoxin reductase subunit